MWGFVFFFFFFFLLWFTSGHFSRQTSWAVRMVWYCALEIPAGMAIRREEHLKRILFSYNLTQKTTRSGLNSSSIPHCWNSLGGEGGEHLPCVSTAWLSIMERIVLFFLEISVLTLLMVTTYLYVIGLGLSPPKEQLALWTGQKALLSHLWVCV